MVFVYLCTPMLHEVVINNVERYTEKLFPAASVDRGGVSSDKERGGGV